MDQKIGTVEVDILNVDGVKEVIEAAVKLVERFDRGVHIGMSNSVERLRGALKELEAKRGANQ